jgi:hypothetical protein
MPEIRLICFNEEVIESNGIKLTVLKPTFMHELKTRISLDLDQNDEEIYDKFKDILYGKDCPNLLIKVLSNGMSTERLVRAFKKYRKYILFPKPSKITEVSVLLKPNSSSPEENIIMSNNLLEKKIPISGDYYVFDGETESSESDIVGVTITTVDGSRLVLLSEVSKKLEEPEKKKAKKRRRRRKTKTSSAKPKKRKGTRRKKRKSRRKSKKKR